MKYTQAEIESKMNMLLVKIELKEKEKEEINKKIRSFKKELKNLEQLKNQYKLF